MKEAKTRYNRKINQDLSPNNQQAFDSFDLKKFLILFKKNIIWITLFFLIAVFSAIFYIRYTNVAYSASAEIKLNKTNEASLFGFPNVSEETSNYAALSGEVELIKSKLFLKEVSAKIPLQVSYDLVGRFKNEERYKFLPFEFIYNESCQSSTNQFFVKIINEKQFKIAIDAESEDWLTASFDQPFSFGTCSYILKKTQYFFSDQTMIVTIHSPEQVLDYLESKLKVAPENLNASTIKIEFTDYNAYKVTDIVNTISELYTRYSIDQKNQANELKINFLNSQLRDIESVLENFETNMEEFTLKNKTADPNEDIAISIQQLSAIDSSLYHLKYTLSKMQELKLGLEEDSFKLNLTNKIPADLKEQILQYEEINRELLLARTKYKNESQIINELELRAKVFRNDIKGAIDNTINNLKNQLEIQNSRKNKLTSTFLTLPAKANELNKKMRFYSIYESLYLTLMQKKTEFQIAKAGTTAEVVILRPASLPSKPVGPSSLILFIGAILLGFLISIIFLTAKFLLYDEINSLAELERLTNLPIVGTIFRVRSSVGKKTGVLVFEKPRAQISENFRSLRTGLNFMGLNKDQKIIAVSSSISGEGKTFVAVNLAAVLSLSNKKTIILDLDLRKPRAQYAFNIEKGDEGMSAILSGNTNWRNCVHVTQNENLHLISSGEIPPNPAELLDSEYFENLLAELKEEYDIIILDTPPIGLVSDGLIALKKADQSLFIVRADYSRRGFIKELHRNVELNGLSNISIVLNALRNNKPGYGYYQDYYENNTSKSVLSLKKFFKLG